MIMDRSIRTSRVNCVGSDVRGVLREGSRGRISML